MAHVHADGRFRCGGTAAVERRASWLGNLGTTAVEQGRCRRLDSSESCAIVDGGHMAENRYPFGRWWVGAIIFAVVWFTAYKFAHIVFI